MVPETLRELLASARSLLLTSHANPDGDAIGSELGLARALTALGKRAVIWNFHPAPTLYRALPGHEGIHVGGQPPPGFPSAFDAAVVLECPSLERTGLAERLRELPLVNIDHHLGNEAYGAVNWVEPRAPAVGVMVAELAGEIGAPIDEATADCLLLALVTDTGGFRFSNADPAAFRAAARLIELGARTETVSRWLYESQPEGAVRLLGEMLATLRRHADGRIASVHLDAAMFARAGAGAGDSEGLIDVPRSIAGVDAVALFRELAAARWKISLRSRGNVDVERVARDFGGGGHRNAAGCLFEGALESARETFVGALARALELADGD